MSLTSISPRQFLWLTNAVLSDQHADRILSDCGPVWVLEKLVRLAVCCEVIKLSAARRGKDTEGIA